MKSHLVLSVTALMLLCVDQSSVLKAYQYYQ